MRVSILCSDEKHPINNHIKLWVKKQSKRYQISIYRRQSELEGGDILFLVSCTDIIKKDTRDKFRHSLVLHASDLPKGRGWSPHIWEIIGGAEWITLSLLEAEDKIDSGRIWHKVNIAIPKTALWDEINEILFDAEMDMIDFALKSADSIEPKDQDGSETATYYRKRTPEDSKIDPDKSIREQFNTLRICDPDRYPAFFEILGQRYELRLEKVQDDEA